MQDKNLDFAGSTRTFINDMASMPKGTFLKYWPRLMSIMDFVLHMYSQVCSAHADPL